MQTIEKLLRFKVIPSYKVVNMLLIHSKCSNYKVHSFNSKEADQFSKSKVHLK